jgi:hypothetical protein
VVQSSKNDLQGWNTSYSLLFFSLCCHCFSNLYRILLFLIDISSPSFMQRSLVKSMSLFQPPCVRLNPHDHQHHCEKQILYDIHDKSTLLLGHLGALCNSPQDAIALLIYEVINYIHSFCSNIFHFNW